MYNQAPENREFNQRDVVTMSLEQTPGVDPRMAAAIRKVDKSVMFAKKILMGHKVANFNASDVVALSAQILAEMQDIEYMDDSQD